MVRIDMKMPNNCMECRFCHYMTNDIADCIVSGWVIESKYIRDKRCQLSTDVKYYNNLIDKDDLIKKINEVEYYGRDEEVDRICTLISEAPLVTVKSTTGEWIRGENIIEGAVECYCSECGNIQELEVDYRGFEDDSETFALFTGYTVPLYNINYCPKCGTMIELG